MTDAERQELYTLMDQWGRNKDVLYQKVRDWIESHEFAALAVKDAEIKALKAMIPQCLPAACRDEYLWRKELSKVQAERDRLQDMLKSRAEELHIDQNGSGLPLKGYGDCHNHIFETCTSPKCVAARTMHSAPASGQSGKSVLDDPKTWEGIGDVK
jgi:hypothetical protein